MYTFELLGLNDMFVMARSDTDFPRYPAAIMSAEKTTQVRILLRTNQKGAR